MSRLQAGALAVLFAIVPLYGMLATLDPSRPPIPPLLPAAGSVAVGLIAVAALVMVATSVVRAVPMDGLTFAFLAPGVATVLAGLFGFDPVFGIGLGLLIVGLGFAGLAVARVAGAATIRLCVRVFLWSALAGCLIALAMVLTHRPAAIYAYNNGRAVGTFLNANELAAYALVGLGLAVPLAITSRGRDRLAVVCALALVVTLGATFSRWGALSAVAGLAVYAFAARARLLLVAAVAVALAGIAVDVTAGARHHNPRDAEARTVAWRTGLVTFERFPLLGVGPLAFAKTYDALRPPEAPGNRNAVAFDPHSLPIAFAADGGIVAVVTLVVSFTIVLRRVLRAARAAPPRARAVAFGLAAGLVALLVDSAINTIVLFFVLGLQVVPLSLAVVRTDALE